MSRSITIIASTGLFATVGLTFAMSQVLSMQPDKLGEGAVKEHFRLRFHPHSESEPRLKIDKGSTEGKIVIRAWLEPKVTEDRQRLQYNLREFLWGATYVSGDPESVWVTFQNPVTGLRSQRRLDPYQPKRVPDAILPTTDPKGEGSKQPQDGSRTKNPDQSVPNDRKGKGFKSHSSSSKIR